MPSKVFRDGFAWTRGNRIAADCCWSRVRVQICSRLKDRGCLARPSGTDPSGLAGTELQRIAAGAGCWRKSVEEGLRGSGGTAIFQMATSTPTLPGSVSAATLSFMVAHRKLRIVVVVAEV